MLEEDGAGRRQVAEARADGAAPDWPEMKATPCPCGAPGLRGGVAVGHRASYSASDRCGGASSELVSLAVVGDEVAHRHVSNLLPRKFIRCDKIEPRYIQRLRFERQQEKQLRPYPVPSPSVSSSSLFPPSTMVDKAAKAAGTDGLKEPPPREHVIRRLRLLC